MGSTEDSFDEWMNNYLLDYEDSMDYNDRVHVLDTAVEALRLHEKR